MRFRAEGDIPVQLDDLLNDGLTFDDNMDGAFIEVVTTGDVQELFHGLGRVANGFLVTQIQQNEDFEPVLVDTNSDILVDKNEDDWLLFVKAVPATFERKDVSFWAVDLDQWTREILFFKSSVASLTVRLFVL